MNLKIKFEFVTCNFEIVKLQNLWELKYFKAFKIVHPNFKVFINFYLEFFDTFKTLRIEMFWKWKFLTFWDLWNCKKCKSLTLLKFEVFLKCYRFWNFQTFKIVHEISSYFLLVFSDICTQPIYLGFLCPFVIIITHMNWWSLILYSVVDNKSYKWSHMTVGIILNFMNDTVSRL